MKEISYWHKLKMSVCLPSKILECVSVRTFLTPLRLAPGWVTVQPTADQKENAAGGTAPTVQTCWPHPDPERDRRTLSSKREDTENACFSTAIIKWSAIYSLRGFHWVCPAWYNVAVWQTETQHLSWQDLNSTVRNTPTHSYKQIRNLYSTDTRFLWSIRMWSVYINIWRRALCLIHPRKHEHPALKSGTKQTCNYCQISQTWTSQAGEVK